MLEFSSAGVRKPCLGVLRRATPIESGGVIRDEQCTAESVLRQRNTSLEPLRPGGGGNPTCREGTRNQVPPNSKVTFPLSVAISKGRGLGRSPAETGVCPSLSVLT